VPGNFVQDLKEMKELKKNRFACGCGAARVLFLMGGLGRASPFLMGGLGGLVSYPRGGDSPLRIS
jgi:hypothetical protein